MDEDQRIDDLNSLLRSLFEHRAYVKTWAGRLPTNAAQAEFLALQIGYPRSGWGGSPADFVTRDPHEAAVTLSMLSTQSQAYEFNRLPAVDLTQRVEDGLRSALPTGAFLCNADHLTPWTDVDPPIRSGDADHVIEVSATRSVTFGVKLTSATFDTGLMGFDKDVGFIAWAEEED